LQAAAESKEWNRDARSCRAGSGSLSAVGAQAATTSSSTKKKPVKLIKPATVTATTPGTELIPLKPTAAGRKILKLKHKLKIKVQVSFRRPEEWLRLRPSLLC
jgi:hypothetical protein